MMRDWPDAYKTVCGYVCCNIGKPCEFANKYGYCKITGCVKQPDYIQTWVWMIPNGSEKNV